MSDDGFEGRTPREVRPGRWARRLRERELADARAVSLAVVERCLLTRRPAAGLLAELGRSLDTRDRALAQRLVTLQLRWLSRLDNVVAQAAGRPIGRVDRHLLGPLRLGVAQLLFMERIPAHAAVSTSVDLAASRSRAGARFVNAVLRRVAEAGGLEDFPVESADAVRRLAVETSHPVFLVERWYRRFGEERTERLLGSNNRDRRAAFLVVGGRDQRPAVIERLAREGVVAQPSVVSPSGLLIDDGDVVSTDTFRKGAVYPQDEASQAAALIPPPEAGELVLDAAAAPGGKTLSLMAWEERLRVVAADGDVSRLERLRANRDRGAVATSRWSLRTRADRL